MPTLTKLLFPSVLCLYTTAFCLLFYLTKNKPVVNFNKHKNAVNQLVCCSVTVVAKKILSNFIECLPCDFLWPHLTALRTIYHWWRVWFIDQQKCLPWSKSFTLLFHDFHKNVSSIRFYKERCQKNLSCVYHWFMYQTLLLCNQTFMVRSVLFNVRRLFSTGV